ncbi:MAG: hypothetical protein M3277_12520 [Actinomycetota bacterium]|nr:hypothetical protein [Actinomycetota bacterium]
MESLTASIGSYSSLSVLAFAGISHLRTSRRFAFAIQLQTGLRPSYARAVAAIVTAAEILLAAAGFTAIVVDSSGALRTAMVVVAGLYGAYALYSGFLVRRRPGVPCGCSSDDISTSIWVVARAGALGIAAGAASRSPGEVVEWAPSADFAIAAFSAGAFAVLLWNLPAALHRAVVVQPEPR